jgi:hypothetical protein
MGDSFRNNKSAGNQFATTSGAGFPSQPVTVAWMNESKGGSTTGYPGMLPTLGLNLYKDTDL